MTQNVTNDYIQDSDKPLPLIVASHWNFPLAHHQTEQGMFFAVQDWMRGLTGDDDTRYLLAKFKKTDTGKQVFNSIQRLPYKASDGKIYQRDYADTDGLKLIALRLKAKKSSPQLKRIQNYLMTGIIDDSPLEKLSDSYREYEFHKEVRDWLNTNGFTDISYEVKVPMAGRADFVGSHPELGNCVIECKIHTHRFVQTISQVWAYAYVLKSNPIIIFTKETEITDEFKKIARDFNVTLLQI